MKKQIVLTLVAMLGLVLSASALTTIYKQQAFAQFCVVVNGVVHCHAVPVPPGTPGAPGAPGAPGTNGASGGAPGAGGAGINGASGTTSIGG